MTILTVLLLAAADPGAAELFANYRRLTVAAVRCRAADDADEVVVCARRDADRYRVPIVGPPDPGDPRYESVAAERLRLQAPRDNCAEKSAFLIGCGKVGVGVTTGGNGTRVFTEREIAP